MFKNFFRKVRATLKNSSEGIAALAGLSPLVTGGMNPLVGLAAKYLPNLLTSQYQDNPLGEFVKSTAITKGIDEFITPQISGMMGNVPQTKADYNTVSGEVAGIPYDETSPEYGKAIQDLSQGNINVREATKGKFGLGDIFTGLYDDDGLTGKGKLLGGLAATLGPGLATYLALMGEEPENIEDASAYRSSVDDYYSAVARGENPNPADFGLAPTPAEDMVKGLSYNIMEDKYEDVPATRAGGGIMNLFNGGDVTEEMEISLRDNPQGNLMEVLKIREEANAPRRLAGLNSFDVTEDLSEEVVRAKTGGIIGLALGGDGLEKRGMVRGPGGPKDDKIPAMLSNGEFVMTAKAVDNAGGPNAMYGLMNKLDPESSRAPKSVRT